MKFHITLQQDPELQEGFRKLFKDGFAKNPYGTGFLEFANSPLSPSLIEELHKKFGYIYSSSSEKNGIHFNTPVHKKVSLYYWEDIYSNDYLEETRKNYGYKILYHLHDDWSEIRPFFDNLQNEFREVLTRTIENKGQVPLHEHYDHRGDEPLLRMNEHGFYLFDITLFHFLYSEFWSFQKSLEVIDRQSHLKSCSQCKAFFYLKKSFSVKPKSIFCTKNCKNNHTNNKKEKPRHLRANT